MVEIKPQKLNLNATMVVLNLRSNQLEERGVEKYQPVEWEKREKEGKWESGKVEGTRGAI
ncbi:hypothetical protein TSUD_94180 [Trifolium subterraneum]|uniref:Uncharacterized protein n=1 Tax=Trifolium subterraneum TaxID=3900 RepID=A0A2Z6PDH7_TRISU|nr:hypothetical protein TSUD_94180 [Trifolium subterraneum]